MKLIHIRRIRFLGFFLLCGFSGTLFAKTILNMHGARYCEVIVSYNRFTYYVYNTLGLNNCPEAIWNQLSASKLKKELRASFVYLNGPRYMLMDKMVKTTLINPTIKNFDQLEAREAGILHLTLMDLAHGSKPYIEHTVNRQTTWVYLKGSRVYELINPNGKIYVMQSYSLEKKPQTENDLKNLGSILRLPKGWQFKTGVLKADKQVIAVDDKATVIQDDFMNTYQLATADLLN